MTRAFLLLILFTILWEASKAQTFTGGGGNIPDNGITNYYPVQVSGIGIINNNLGVANVCIDITHSWVGDLEVYLKAPDGTLVPLSIQNGGSGNNYQNTCFVSTASIALEDGLAPFNGTFIPDGYLGNMNNGQNADGTWNLGIKDVNTGETGVLNNWSINFSTGLPPLPPVCNANAAPGNTCATATPICSLYGFCASTSTSYTADSWPELDAEFCGTVQNNAFVKFVATGYEMNFNVWVTSSTNHDGIQMFFYDGGCGSGAVTNYGCYSPIRPGASPTVVSATGLTAGNTYYIMIDGFAGDECDYVMEPLPATGGLAAAASSNNVCPGKSVELSASGGNGNYTWTGPGLNTYTGNTVTATPAANTFYTVSSVDPGGMCPVTKRLDIRLLPVTPPPSVPDTLVYCQYVGAPALSATGSNLAWYTSLNTGVGTNTAITPATNAVGLFTYYVSQTMGCESNRVPLYTKILPAPSLGFDKNEVVCQGKTVNLTNEFNYAGLISTWSFQNMPISAPLAVNTPGDYQLAVTNSNGCSDTGTVHLHLQPPLHVFAGKDTIAVSNMPHQLHCTPAASYSWSPAYLLNDPYTRFPKAIMNHDQEFIVQVTDEAGCKGSDTILVKIIPGTTYYVPNAFTPNNDGLNDILKALPVGIRSTEYFRVLNRYGKILFETNDPFNKGWDGSYLGTTQAAGTYVWLIKGIDIRGHIIEMKGTVVLIH